MSLGTAYFQPLSWNLRMKIALGAAKGLSYLHSPEAKVIYRDFKSSNILLDVVWGIIVLSPHSKIFTLFKRISFLIAILINWQNYNAKLSDFGLAKDGPMDGKSHVSTRVMGTYGYAAPEYMATGIQILHFL